MAGLLDYFPGGGQGEGIGGLLAWLDSKRKVAGQNIGGLLAGKQDTFDQMGNAAAELLKGKGQDVREALQASQSAIPELKQQGQDQLAQVLLNSGVIAPLTFAGVGAKTADKVALQKAQQMANVGEDPVKIWQTTGWTEQFPDKKWRFEIPDDKTYLKHVTNIDKGLSSAGNLDHPQLYSAYYGLEAVPKTIQFGTRVENAGGSYSLTPVERIAAGGVDPAAARSVTLHELQHAIQQREGFARGGSPEPGLGTLLPEGWRGPEAEAALLAKQIQQWEGKYSKALKERIKEVDPAIVPIAQHWAKTKTIDELRNLSGNADYEAYKRLAGEAESRLTQSRMALTAAERMQHPPWLPGQYGFDVPPEQQIVRGLLNP